MQLSYDNNRMWGRELGDKGRIKEENRKNSYLFHCSEGWLHNTKFEWLSFPQNNLHFLQNHPHQVRQFLHSVHWSLKKRPKSWLILFKLRQVATKGLISLTIEGTQKWCGKTGDKKTVRYWYRSPYITLTNNFTCCSPILSVDLAGLCRSECNSGTSFQPAREWNQPLYLSLFLFYMQWLLLVEWRLTQSNRMSDIESTRTLSVCLCCNSFSNLNRYNHTQMKSCLYTYIQGYFCAP